MEADLTVDQGISYPENILGQDRGTRGKPEVTSGVPQGLMLGLLMFLHFINGLDHTLRLPSILFAGDVKAAGSAGIADLISKLGFLLDWTGEMEGKPFVISKYWKPHMTRDCLL